MDTESAQDNIFKDDFIPSDVLDIDYQHKPGVLPRVQVAAKSDECPLKKVSQKEYEQLVSDVEFLEVMFEAQAIGSTERSRPPPDRTNSEPGLGDVHISANSENGTLSMPPIANDNLSRPEDKFRKIERESPVQIQCRIPPIVGETTVQTERLQQTVPTEQRMALDKNNARLPHTSIPPLVPPRTNSSVPPLVPPRTNSSVPPLVPPRTIVHVDNVEIHVAREENISNQDTVEGSATTRRQSYINPVITAVSPVRDPPIPRDNYVNPHGRSQNYYPPWYISPEANANPERGQRIASSNKVTAAAGSPISKEAWGPNQNEGYQYGYTNQPVYREDNRIPDNRPGVFNDKFERNEAMEMRLPQGFDMPLNNEMSIRTQQRKNSVSAQPDLEETNYQLQRAYAMQMHRQMNVSDIQADGKIKTVADNRAIPNIASVSSAVSSRMLPNQVPDNRNVSSVSTDHNDDKAARLPWPEERKYMAVMESSRINEDGKFSDYRNMSSGSSDFNTATRTLPESKQQQHMPIIESPRIIDDRISPSEDKTRRNTQNNPEGLEHRECNAGLRRDLSAENQLALVSNDNVSVEAPPRPAPRVMCAYSEQPQTQYMPVRTINPSTPVPSQRPSQRPIPTPRKKSSIKGQQSPLISNEREQLETTSPALNMLHLRDLRNALEQLCYTLSPQEEKYNLIKDIMKLVCPLNAKYEVISLLDLLQQNQRPEIVEMVPRAFNILEKYATNLLKPEKDRPASWRLIKFSNGVFQKKVDFLHGARDILKSLGYNKDIRDENGTVVGLVYPDTQQEPNIRLVVKLAADICLAKFEVEAIVNGTHPTLSEIKENNRIPSVYLQSCEIFSGPGSLGMSMRSNSPSNFQINQVDVKQDVRQTEQRRLIEPEIEQRQTDQRLLTEQQMQQQRHWQEQQWQQQHHWQQQQPQQHGMQQHQQIPRYQGERFPLQEQQHYFQQQQQLGYPHQQQQQQHSNQYLYQMPHQEQLEYGQQRRHEFENQEHQQPEYGQQRHEPQQSHQHQQPKYGQQRHEPQQSQQQQVAYDVQQQQHYHIDQRQQSDHQNQSIPQSKCQGMPQQQQIGFETFNERDYNQPIYPIDSVDASHSVDTSPRIPAFIQRQNYFPEKSDIFSSDTTWIHKSGVLSAQTDSKPQTGFPDHDRNMSTYKRSESNQFRPPETSQPPYISIAQNTGNAPDKNTYEQSVYYPPNEPMLPSLYEKWKPSSSPSKSLPQRNDRQLNLEPSIYHSEHVQFTSGYENGSAPEDSHNKQQQQQSLYQDHSVQQILSEKGRDDIRQSPDKRPPEQFPASTNQGSAAQSMKSEDISPTTACWECGYEHQQDARFCPKCGINVEVSTKLPTLYNSDSSDVSSLGESQNQRTKKDNSSEFPSVGESVNQRPKQEYNEQPYPEREKIANDRTKQSSTAPKGEWNCIHCTFLNLPGSNVCGMCYKTSWIQEEHDEEDPPIIIATYPKRHFGGSGAGANVKNRPPVADPTDEINLQSSTRVKPSPDQEFPDINQSPFASMPPPRKDHQREMSPVKSYPGDLSKLERDMLGFPGEKSLHTQPLHTQPLHTQPLYPQQVIPSEMNVPHQYRINGAGGIPNKMIEAKPHPFHPHQHRTTAPSLRLMSMPAQMINYGYSEMSGHELRKQMELRDRVEREKKQQDQLKQEAQAFVKMLKQAERVGYTVKEFGIATEKCGDVGGYAPINWLKEAWPKLIQQVIASCANNDNIGEISFKESKAALMERDGDIEVAIQHCVKKRRDQIKEIEVYGVPCQKEDIIRVLSECQGDDKATILALERKAFKKFREASLKDPADTIKSFYARIQDPNINFEDRTRLVFAQYGLPSWGRAETAMKLIMKHNTRIEECIDAARNCGYYEMAEKYMGHECCICYEVTSMGRLKTNLHCQCLFCDDCLAQYFQSTISEKHLRHLCCPFCQLPDLEDEGLAEGYLTNLDMVIMALMNQGLIDNKVHELFQTKVRDFALKKDPNFRWCAHECESGFVWDEPERLKMRCDQCSKHTCFLCKEKWLDQHEGVTCEQFRTWKESNDPEFQAAGLAAHLARNGIECPSCHFRYDLSRGGCMHFKCSQCGFEFCCGCDQPYKKGAQCQVNATCAHKGLHAHHPRDCSFYLRDWSKEELQELLKYNEIAHDTEVPQAEDEKEEEEEEEGARAQAVCQVNEQKEDQGQLRDEVCGKEAEEGCAGLCDKHFKEYLVTLINNNKLDPVELMDKEKIVIICQRGFKQIPKQEKKESDKAYTERLRKHTKEQLPLPNNIKDPVLVGAAANQPEQPLLVQEQEEEELQDEDDDIIPLIN